MGGGGRRLKNLLYYFYFVPSRKFGLPYLTPCYLGKAQQLQEQRCSFLSVSAVFLCDQTMIWLPVLESFTMRMDVDACDCKQGLYGHRKRVCSKS